MNLKAFKTKNFRRLRDVEVQLDAPTTIFVGANNSGKTSATHVLQMFLGETGEKFAIHDFSADCWRQFDELKFGESEETSGNPSLPAISVDLWFQVTEDDLHRVIDLLPSLEWKNTLIGVRIEYAAKNPVELKNNFIIARNEAKAKNKGATGEAHGFIGWPRTLTEYLSQRLEKEYEKQYFVLDRAQFDDNLDQKPIYFPLPLGSTDRSGASILKTLIKVDFLSAQKHLSDINSPGRSEDLSRRLSKFYDRNLEQQNAADNFEAVRALANSEEQLNSHLAKVFSPTLEKLNRLGYPGFSDPNIVIKSVINPETVLKQTAQVHYELNAPGGAGKNIVLPDKYNGLGFKMLIYMVVELLDFHARWVATENERAPLHLVIIEEPEAHLHAQLQQVFIRKVLEILPKESSSSFATQLIVTTHSPHIIHDAGFLPIRYFRRLNDPMFGQCTEVLNLSTFQGTSRSEAKQFLLQYMKLTHCDLFFADALILVEGNVERLLLPLMIAKAAPKLEFSYLSILEVGGAYAHKFKELIHFLGLTTLVITDLDSVTPAQSKASADSKEADDDDAKGGKSCQWNMLGAETSNQCLREWLPKRTTVQDLLQADDAAKQYKIPPNRSTSIRVCYQTVQKVSWNSNEGDFAGRTLEEAFALENLEWCQKSEQKDLQLRIKNGATNSLEQLVDKLFRRVNSKDFKKTDFALCLMTKEATEWRVPTYIHEGLLWLQDQLKPASPSNPGDDKADVNK